MSSLSLSDLAVFTGTEKSLPTLDPPADLHGRYRLPRRACQPPAPVSGSTVKMAANVAKRPSSLVKSARNL